MVLFPAFKDSEKVIMISVFRAGLGTSRGTCIRRPPNSWHSLDMASSPMRSSIFWDVVINRSPRNRSVCVSAAPFIIIQWRIKRFGNKCAMRAMVYRSHAKVVAFVQIDKNFCHYPIFPLRHVLPSTFHIPCSSVSRLSGNIRLHLLFQSSEATSFR